MATSWGNWTFRPIKYYGMKLTNLHEYELANTGYAQGMGERQRETMMGYVAHRENIPGVGEVDYVVCEVDQMFVVCAVRDESVWGDKDDYGYVKFRLSDTLGRGFTARNDAVATVIQHITDKLRINDPMN